MPKFHRFKQVRITTARLRGGGVTSVTSEGLSMFPFTLIFKKFIYRTPGVPVYTSAVRVDEFPSCRCRRKPYSPALALYPHEPSGSVFTFSYFPLKKGTAHIIVHPLALLSDPRLMYISPRLIDGPRKRILYVLLLFRILVILIYQLLRLFQAHTTPLPFVIAKLSNDFATAKSSFISNFELHISNF